MDTTIVLPAHNEEELLEQTVEAIRSGLKDYAQTWEILIIENGSTDRTLQIGDRCRSPYPRYLWSRFPRETTVPH